MVLPEEHATAAPWAIPVGAAHGASAHVNVLGTKTPRVHESVDTLAWYPTLHSAVQD